MKTFAQAVGQSTAAILDGAQDLLEDSYHATKIASAACAKGYAEQHALNVRRRAERRAKRMRTHISNNAVLVRPEWRAS